jgi:TrmH family RNA methyltransferase
MLEKIRIILLHTSHSGNVGSVSRAMKVMGLSRLCLVDPQCDHLDGKGRALACHGADVLEQAVVCSEFDQALEGAELVFGTSARKRTFGHELLPARQAAERMVGEAGEREIALVFGSEKSGMTNEEIDRCHIHIHIPTSDEYSSLNLSQAVQVMVYELFMASLQEQPAAARKRQSALATANELDGLYKHIESIMKQTGFYKADHPRMMETRLRQLFNRAELDKQDLNLLRGILASVDFKI